LLKRSETWPRRFLTEKFDSKVCQESGAVGLDLDREVSPMVSKTNRPNIRQASLSIPVDVEHVDQLVAVARDLAGFVLILDAAALGEPVLAAVARILEPINEQLQDFRGWFHNGWCVASRSANKSGGKSTE
jgi:hypothetical protein